MLSDEISLIGWLHALAALIALPVGAWLLIAPKGLPRHRALGWLYVGAMVALNLGAFFIYKFDIIPSRPPQVGPGLFGLFHWFAVATLIAVALAVFAAARQRNSVFWAHVHAQALLFSYYQLLAGLVNQIMARSEGLRALAMTMSPNAANITETSLNRGLMSGLMLLWLSLGILFAVQVGRRHRRPDPNAFTIGHPLRYSGGIFSICLGLSGVAGAFAGNPGLGFLVGIPIGLFLSMRARHLVAPVWGIPSPSQQKMRQFAVIAQTAAFMILGSSGFFQSNPPLVTWQATAAILGSGFLLMRWSHGPIMTWLGVSVLVWLGAGSMLGLPLPLLAIGDGLLKLGFGLTMAEALLSLPRQRPTLQSPTLARISDGVAPASRSEASVTA